MNRLFSIFLVLLFFIGCKATDIKKDSDFPINDKTVNLFAFIGEKISVTEFDPNENNNERIEIDSVTGDTIIQRYYVMDQGFICKYKVLKNVFNQLDTDTIEFRAYDHYGRPGFENYERVILYISVSGDSSHYFHQKYQFDPVIKSPKGRWKGLNGESIEELLNKKKNDVFTDRELFK